MQIRAKKFGYILLLSWVCLSVLVRRGVLFLENKTENHKSPGFILDVTYQVLRSGHKEVLERGWLLSFFYGTH